MEWRGESFRLQLIKDDCFMRNGYGYGVESVKNKGIKKNVKKRTFHSSNLFLCIRKKKTSINHIFL